MYYFQLVNNIKIIHQIHILFYVIVFVSMLLYPRNVHIELHKLGTSQSKPQFEFSSGKLNVSLQLPFIVTNDNIVFDIEAHGKGTLFYPVDRNLNINVNQTNWNEVSSYGGYPIGHLVIDHVSCRPTLSNFLNRKKSTVANNQKIIIVPFVVSLPINKVIIKSMWTQIKQDCNKCFKDKDKGDCMETTDFGVQAIVYLDKPNFISKVSANYYKDVITINCYYFRKLQVIGIFL